MSEFNNWSDFQERLLTASALIELEMLEEELCAFYDAANDESPDCQHLAKHLVELSREILVRTSNQLLGDMRAEVLDMEEFCARLKQTPGSVSRSTNEHVMEVGFRGYAG